MGEIPPGVVITFDDGRPSNYTEAFAYMNAAGLVGTIYAITSVIGTPGFMTVEQLQEVDAAGWDIGNHTATHPNLDGMTQSQIEDEFTTAMNSLNGWNLSRASKHVAYPFGVGAYSQVVENAMVASGMLTGRTTQKFYSNGYPWLELPGYPIPSSDNASTVEAWITAGMAANCVVFLLIHQITDTPGTWDWSITNFQALVDWLVANHIPTYTISEIYDMVNQ